MKALTDTLIDRVDAFLKELFSVERRDGGEKAEIAICEAIEVIIRRRRNSRLVHSRLPADIIHCVFSLALDLDRIHEPDLSLEMLEDHRKQLFQMRCVSAAWNEFLVSGPRYWLAVNLRTPLDILKTNLQHAGETPLCIYSSNRTERRRRTTPSIPDELPLLAFMGQVRTIRSNNESLPVWKGLLQRSMSALETLEITASIDWGNLLNELVAEWLSGTLPMVRNVTSREWQPLSNLAWLGNLRSLVFRRPTRLDVNLLRILGQCSNLSSLRMEVDGTGWNDEEPEDSIPNISLPNLRKLELEFRVLQDVRHLIRRLDIPQSAQGSLNITYAPESEEAVEDLARFIFPEGTQSKPPNNTLLRIHGGEMFYPALVTYTAGTRSITFLVPEEGDLFENILIALQNRLNNPPLHVYINIFTWQQVEVLRRLGNLNVDLIRAECTSGFLDNIFAAIGSRHEILPSGTVGNDHNWPFESLRELILEQADLALSQMPRLVGIRRRYLETSSKGWLKRITLVDCNLRGMSLSLATQQLAGMEVTLVAEGCRHWSDGKK
ncbi:hypothetical protein FS837_010389 [Tulasnella sp. UAMH 9824]|nr:hypothetical protein FS837_010389 [Tulasnella sp. UAMH 9824]